MILKESRQNVLSLWHSKFLCPFSPQRRNEPLPASGLGFPDGPPHSIHRGSRHVPRSRPEKSHSLALLENWCSLLDYNIAVCLFWGFLTGSREILLLCQDNCGFLAGFSKPGVIVDYKSTLVLVGGGEGSPLRATVGAPVALSWLRNTYCSLRP